MTKVTAEDPDRTSHRITNAPSSHLHGRQAELSLLYDLTQRLEQGDGGSVLVRGEVGIGKSALLDAVKTRAENRGMRVASTIGIRSESRLPFAGLHRVLKPILHKTDGLPARHREALLTAFGLSEAHAPELFLIALATLELLADAAEVSPLVLIVDDAQWLDDASSEVLAIVARRLAVEPLLIVAAVRTDHTSGFDDAGLPELRLDSLDEGASSTILDNHAPDLEPLLRQRILEEADGNPLALVELAAFLPHYPAQEALLSSPLPLPERLERSFSAREAEMPSTTRTLLLVAATDESRDLHEVLSAAAILEGTQVTMDAVTPALAAQLVNINGSELRFRHPLVRSAIYQSASLSRRQAAHTALAGVLENQPDRRVWHLAAAITGPSEDVAIELDQAALRARRRGASTIAIAAQQRAAELSATPSLRGGRLLRAAETAFELGRLQLGLELIQVAEPLDLTPEQRTTLSWLRATYDESRWSGVPELRSCLDIAERMREEGQTALAMRFLVTVAMRCWWGNPDQETRAALIHAAERIAASDYDPALIAVLAHADPVGHGKVAIERISQIPLDNSDPEGMYLIGSAAGATWEYDLSLRFLDSAIDGLRAQGRLGLLVPALVARAWAAVHLAREPLAIAAAEEAIRLAQDTGQQRLAAVAQLAQATIHAERGDNEMAEEVMAEAERLLQTSGAIPFLALSQFIRGRAAVAHQHYSDGVNHHKRALDPTDPLYSPFIGAWGLSDLVEAAAHSGDMVMANEYLQRLESLAESTSGSLLRATLGYARPMVADDADAEALYQHAIDHDLTNWPCYRGRMLLWYGRWLRRQNRLVESRSPLRTAREGFDALGFPALAEAARLELRASGEASESRTIQAWDQLTPQELQVANLAADGLSNREIGEQLFISHRTVGYHLYHIYPKLGLTSRSQLHAALAG